MPAIAPVLAGRDDLILVDELAHSSLWTGARLSRAETLPFRPQRTWPMSGNCSASAAPVTAAC